MFDSINACHCNHLRCRTDGTELEREALVNSELFTRKRPDRHISVSIGFRYNFVRLEESAKFCEVQRGLMKFDKVGEVRRLL